jgi:transcription antitermination factor NusG
MWKKQKWDSEGEAVSNTFQLRAEGPTPTPAGDQGQWYAVQTRPRHEKKIVAELRQKSITTFLPLLAEIHRWSDRRKVIEVPLFPGYLFIRAQLDLHVRVAILRAWGVLGFVGPNREASEIPDCQIDTIQALLTAKLPLMPYPFLKIGQRVRVRGGALDGLEGILVTNRGRRLVISVESIQRSLSITIEGYDVQAV